MERCGQNNTEYNVPNEEELTKYYTRIVVETIVACAGIATYRAISWQALIIYILTD